MGINTSKFFSMLSLSRNDRTLGFCLRSQPNDNQFDFDLFSFIMSLAHLIRYFIGFGVRTWHFYVVFCICVPFVTIVRNRFGRLGMKWIEHKHTYIPIKCSQWKSIFNTQAHKHAIKVIINTQIARQIHLLLGYETTHTHPSNRHKVRLLILCCPVRSAGKLPPIRPIIDSSPFNRKRTRECGRTTIIFLFCVHV